MSILIADHEPYNFYDTSEGIAFGPTFEHHEHAGHFLRWVRERIEAVDPPLRIQFAYHSPATWRRWYEEWFSENVDGETGQLLDAYFGYKPGHRVSATMANGDEFVGTVRREAETGWRVELDERPFGYASEHVTVPGDRLRLLARASVA